MSQTQMAARFRALHKGFLVLPNAWDVASARIAEDAGAEAIATSSAAVAWAHGYPDGEKLPKARLLQLVGDIARLSKVPVSADSEAGFSATPAETAAFIVALAKAGAVGINLEDGTDEPPLLVAKIKAIKDACAREGVDVYVNARTDVYLKTLVPAERALDETLARGKLYKDAGADGFFVPWVGDIAAIARIAATIDLPLNALTFRNLPSVSELKSAGVHRLSAGAGTARAAYGATRRAALDLLKGSYAAMNQEAEGCPNLNALMQP
ncbi:MAG TPA: isocitrate lyase/phosphoenolpyruvate mutase family protein [Rhizomicrobium sp.]|nr:isocitrate lyase/phosphoenolpyruvate mutase family protein [Rhizomicrobium sp.]